MTANLDELANRFPKHIPFPNIDRPYRAGHLPLDRVNGVDDLPSRLLLGDLQPASFQRSPKGWQVQYRDQDNGGVDLEVTGSHFFVCPFFLGEKIMASGAANNPKALGMALTGQTANAWQEALKKYLEPKYPVTVVNADTGGKFPTVCFIPDGWLYTILVPVHFGHLNALLAFHNELVESTTLAAPMGASVRLQLHATNYVEGRWDGMNDPYALIIRHLQQAGTPLCEAPVREEAPDGSAAWTIRRLTYLYRSQCFLRDLPRLIDALFLAGFLSDAPDMRAAVMPTEIAMSAATIRWWSEHRECKSVWTDFRFKESVDAGSATATAGLAQAAVRQAMDAGEAYLGGLGSAPAG